MLISIRSEIMDQKNCNQEKCNIPEEEVIAFKELIKLQKQRIITIKAADKGAIIVILDFKDYMKSCYDHLNYCQVYPITMIKKEQIQKCIVN